MWRTDDDGSSALCAIHPASTVITHTSAIVESHFWVYKSSMGVLWHCCSLYGSVGYVCWRFRWEILAFYISSVYNLFPYILGGHRAPEGFPMRSVSPVQAWHICARYMYTMPPLALRTLRQSKPIFLPMCIATARQGQEHG